MKTPGKTLLVGLLLLAASCMLPRMVDAEPAGDPNIYIIVDTGNRAGEIDEYDAITGAPVNVPLVGGLTGGPLDLAVSGNQLYEVNTNTPSLEYPGLGNTVGEYDATDGTPINSTLITRVVNPAGIVVLNNIIYLTNDDYGSDAVGKFNATSGKAVNARFITGLHFPAGIAISNNRIYVADSGKEKVCEYNATTGASIKSNFITGLTEPAGLAVSGTVLYLTNYAPLSDSGVVGEYNATTGEAINANFITGFVEPGGIAVLGNVLYVADAGTGVIGTYDATTGESIIPDLITVTGAPAGIAISGSAPAASKYTLLLSATDTTALSGSGYATMTVSKLLGTVTAGKLPDGESFRTSAYIVSGSEGYQLAIDEALSYPSVTVKHAKGSLTGALTFATVTGSSEFSGTLAWVKPGQTKGAYPAPINTTMDVLGSLYLPPAPGGSVLPGFTSGTVTLSDTSGFSLVVDVILNSKNQFKVNGPNPDKLTIADTLSTGVIKGKFLYPTSISPPKSKSVDYIAVLYQDQISGAGYFLGPNGSGMVSLSQ